MMVIIIHPGKEMRVHGKLWAGQHTKVSQSFTDSMEDK